MAPETRSGQPAGRGGLTRRSLLLLALGAGAGAALSACGAAATSTVSATTSASAAPAATTASQAPSLTATTSAPATTSAASSAVTSAAASTQAPATTTASAASAASAAKPGARVSISWWSGWGSGGATAKTFDQVAQAANQQASDYQVQHEAQSSVAKKLATVIAAGTPPDVEVGNLAYPEFWASNQAIALDSYLAKSTVIDHTDIFDASWKFGSYQGKTYGVPAVESFMRWGLLANQDLLAKRNLDPAALPNNWADLLEWHKQLTVLDPATKQISQLGLDPLDAMGGSASGGDPFFWGPSFGLGTKYYDEGAQQFNLAGPELEEALTTIKQFYDVAGGYAAIQTFRKTNATWTGAKAGIVVGTQAMQINGYWTPGSIVALAPDKHFSYSWAPVSPARKGTKMQSTGGHFAVLPKGSPHPDQAFQFAEYLSSAPAEQIIFDGSGWLGARKSFLSKVNASKFPGLDFYLKSATTADELWADPVDPIEGFFSDTWQTQAQKVFQGQASARDALQELQQLCTAELHKRLGTA